MDNKYNTFDNAPLDYSYPITWNKRNKEYLEKIDNRVVNNQDEYQFDFDDQYYPSEDRPHNPEIEKKNYLIINCGDSVNI